MILLLAFVKKAFLFVDQFAARHWRKFVLGGSLILSLLTLRACYEAGRYQQAVRDNPPLSTHEVQRIAKAATQDQAKAQVAKASADSLLKNAAATEKRIISQLHTIHKLQVKYHEIKPDTAAAAVRAFLASYVPGSDSL